MPLAGFLRLSSRVMLISSGEGTLSSNQKDLTMTGTRFDGASLAPAARLRPHGSSRRALDRVVSIREVQSRRAINGRLLLSDDATRAMFGWDGLDIDRTGLSTYPL